MSTTTLTLADFLLARISEGEAEWRRVATSPRGFGKTHARRHLAECEAKRRIIGWVTDDTIICEVTDPILRALALPYADHPDYREEWKPRPGCYATPGGCPWPRSPNRSDAPDPPSTGNSARRRVTPTGSTRRSPRDDRRSR